MPCLSTLLAYFPSKGRCSSSWGQPDLRATGCRLPHGITQCYL